MNGVPRISCLRFGVPSLDDLFGTFSLSHRAYGIPINNIQEQTKLTPELCTKKPSASALRRRCVILA